MNDLDVVRRRMAAQGLTAARAESPAEVVRRLGAVQAQEFAEATWSLAERIESEPTDAEIEAAFDRGEIIRTHVLRPTWHFVAPEDLHWMLKLTAPRVHRSVAAYYRQHDLDEGTLAHADESVATVLGDGEPRTRRELGVALAEDGIHAETPRLAFIAFPPSSRG